jgi:hypothetical protein
MLESLKMHLRRMSPFPGARLPRRAADADSSQGIAASCHSEPQLAEPAATGAGRAALAAAQSAPLPAAEAQHDGGSGADEDGQRTRPALGNGYAQVAGAPPAPTLDRTSQQDDELERGGEGSPGCTAASGGGSESQALQQQQQAVDVEAQQSVHVRFEGDAGGGAPPGGSSVFRRCCPWLLACTPRRSRQEQWAAARTLRRSQSFADS